MLVASPLTSKGSQVEKEVRLYKKKNKNTLNQTYVKLP